MRSGNLIGIEFRFGIYFTCLEGGLGVCAVGVAQDELHIVRSLGDEVVTRIELP